MCALSASFHIPRKLCKYHNWLVKIFFPTQVSSQNPDWKFSLLLSSGLKPKTQSGGQGVGVECLLRENIRTINHIVRSNPSQGLILSASCFAPSLTLLCFKGFWDLRYICCTLSSEFSISHPAGRRQTGKVWVTDWTAQEGPNSSTSTGTDQVSLPEGSLPPPAASQLSTFAFSISPSRQGMF